MKFSLVIQKDNVEANLLGYDTQKEPDVFFTFENEANTDNPCKTDDNVFGTDCREPMLAICRIIAEIKNKKIDPQKLYATIKNKEVNLAAYGTEPNNAQAAGTYRIRVYNIFESFSKAKTNPLLHAAAVVEVENDGSFKVKDASHNHMFPLPGVDDTSKLKALEGAELFGADYRDALPLLALLTKGLASKEIDSDKLLRFVKEKQNMLACDEDEAAI